MGEIIVKSTMWHLDVDAGSGEVHPKARGPKGATGDQGIPGPPNTGSFINNIDLTAAMYGFENRFDALEAVDPWHYAFYRNGYKTYTDANPDWNDPARYRYHRGMVHLEGLVCRPDGVGPSTIFVLPTEYAPSEKVGFPIYTATGIGLISVYPDASVNIISGDTSGGTVYIQLFNIKFGPAWND